MATIEDARAITASADAAAVKAGVKKLRTRGEAAFIVSNIISAPYSEEALRKSAVPYRIISGRALYDDDDLIDHAKALFDGAPIRRGRAA